MCYWFIAVNCWLGWKEQVDERNKKMVGLDPAVPTKKHTVDPRVFQKDLMCAHW